MAVLNRAQRVSLEAAAAAIILLCANVTAQAQAGEEAIKAAFLYNFTKFVDWPASAFEGTTGPFRVCVFADEAFAREMEAIVRGETVRGRPIQLWSPNSPGAARGCHIAYFDRGQQQQIARILPAVRQTTVLTVGDTARFLESGGAISFVLENNRIRFDVNMKALDSAGLTVSSKLLRVARHVERESTQ